MAPNHPPASASARITSIDALRGLVMAAMIFVNDLAGAGDVVPDWMVHFSERHARGSGMTFVDLVFPAFLFIVGMSLPFALEAQLKKSGGLRSTLVHVATRTLSLLLIGVMMVNENPDAVRMGWSPALWSTLLYLAAIGAFCDFTPRATASAAGRNAPALGRAIRVLSLGVIAFLATSFVGADGHRIITLVPFSIHHEWWGILGLIGWAYLVGAVIYLIFRAQRTALLGCMALLLCLYPAERAGLFEGFWLARHVGFGATLGSQAAITVGGLLLASILVADAGLASPRARIRFSLLFIAATSAAAIFVHGLYGISKNSATPSWCLWSCAITGALWLGFYLVSDVAGQRALVGPLVLAGRNVLLAYLLSDLLPSLLALTGLETGYAQLASTLPGAIARSLACAVALLAATVGLNRLGLRLRL